MHHIIIMYLVKLFPQNKQMTKQQRQRVGRKTSDKQFIRGGISGTLQPRRLIRNFIL